MEYDDRLRAKQHSLSQWLNRDLKPLTDQSVCIGAWKAHLMHTLGPRGEFEFYSDGRMRRRIDRPRATFERYWRVVEPGRLIVFTEDPSDVSPDKWQYVGAEGFEFAFVDGSDCIVVSNDDTSVVYILHRISKGDAHE